MKFKINFVRVLKNEQGLVAVLHTVIKITSFK